MINEDINKYLAKMMGECWHEVKDYESDPQWNGCHYCLCKWPKANFPLLQIHPDYHTPSGFFKLLEYMKGREDWNKFVVWYLGKEWKSGEPKATILAMIGLIDYKTFPFEIYQWLKEER